MESLEDYAEKVVKEYLEHITDHIFVHIQNNEPLMRSYQSQVHLNSLMLVNTAIGKKVKEIFSLENESECHHPKSWLIKSYTKHKK